ncbi:uncharacterized protein LOC105179431 [Sesamum indicum]|uniref:Uncharacterized protein LOC105179431 n=1 Tax=Sesamum indicum TaxID=4182 RepID=A0A6I9ULD5_SESIN|nr:uncharacterized protein LOC105179431 [Sesamum indicum]
METNKFNGTNYNNRLQNLKIVLNFKNQVYVFDKSLPTTLLKGSLLKECVTFERWHENNCKVRCTILALMINDFQKKYDRLEYIPSIMLHIKEVYATPDRHIRYAATKAFFVTKMTEGFSMQRHGVKMLPSQRSSKTSKLGLTVSCTSM